MKNFTRVSVVLLTSACLLTACGDDSAPAGDSADASSTGGDTSAMGESSGTFDPTVPMPGTTSDDASTTGNGSTSTGGEDESSSGDDASSSGGEVEQEWGALVVGTLSTDDLEMAQATHDAVAMGGQAAAMVAGDFAHDAMLGTTLLGSTENEFLGIDRWTNLDGALAVYGDPKFQAGFGMLFAAQPSLDLFAKRNDWHGWGSLEDGDGGDHWFVVVRGRLAEADLDAAQAAHDAIAAAGEADATALGDVAHVVWVGTPDDPQEFFAVDVWTDDSMIEAFYGNPKFAEAFGTLFDAPPSVAVYGSTDWHQW